MIRLPAACLLLALAATASAAEVTVSSPAELRAALPALGDGDTLRIAPGEYPGGHQVAGRTGLTVTAADPTRPPLFVGGGEAWHFSRCPGLTVTHLRARGQTDNGINVDDGGERDRPIAGITLAHLEIHEVGPRGNHDGIKGSGLSDLTIRDCHIEGWGGQGIDLVGCHRGRITGCRLVGREGCDATAGVQLKGGCSEIVVEGCRFQNAGGRPLNLGGSTDHGFFRPPDAKHEAAKLVVRDNVIEGGECAAAFVGVDGLEFCGNTILFPERWIFRILQETTAPGFAPCRDVRVTGNRIVFRRGQLRADVNVGDGTAPETFVFADNRWFAADRPEASRPALPVPEQGGGYGADPR
jgi:hypothetical protein